MSITIQSVMLPTGVRLPYVEQGDPDDIPVVLLHGLSDSLHSWDLLRPLLPPGFRTIALTQRGHGDASRPLSGYTAGDLAGDVVAVLDALGIPAAVIVGHSLGSVVAQRFAIDYPQRTRALVVIGAIVSFEHVPGVDELLAAINQFEDPVDPDFIRAFQESSVGSAIQPDFFAAALRESAKLPARVWKAVAHGLSTSNHGDQLGRISAPTLALWGALDQTSPRSDQELLAATIPNARLVVYPDLGHSPNWEDPARTAGDLVAFIQSL